jgi:HlyD family secretion protein
MSSPNGRPLHRLDWSAVVGSKLLLIAILVLVLGAGFGAGFYTATRPGVANGDLKKILDRENNGASEKAGQRPQRERVRALGRLEPRGGVVSVGGPAGDRIAAIPVKEGQFVHANDVLVKLESEVERHIELQFAQSQLEEAKRRMDAVTRHGNAQILEAELRERQVLPMSDRDLEVQDDKIRALEAQSREVSKNLERLTHLRERKTGVSDQEVDRQRLQVDQTQAELTAARTVRKKLEAARQYDLNAAHAACETARAGLARFQQEIPMQSLAQNVQLAKDRLARTVIRAKRDGRILKIMAHEGESIGAQPILRMGDTDHMYVIAEVYEADIRFVAPGQSATIKESGSLLTNLTGEVEQVGSTIYKNNLLDIDPTAATDYRVIEVKIRLNNSKPVEKLVNMQVEVEIQCSGAAQEARPDATAS